MGFEELLGETLKTVNAGYDSATKDLSSVIDELQLAVSKLSSDRVAVSLVEATSSTTGTIFDCVVRRTGPFAQSGTRVASFKVDSQGYPVEVGSRDGSEFLWRKTLNSIDDLKAFISEELGNSASQMVVAIAYQMRKR